MKPISLVLLINGARALGAMNQSLADVDPNAVKNYDMDTEIPQTDLDEEQDDEDQAEEQDDQDDEDEETEYKFAR